MPPWEDQCERHRMTRMTRPDCAVMCNLINTHTHTYTHTQDPLATQPDREIDLSLTIRGVGGVSMGVVPCASS